MTKKMLIDATHAEETRVVVLDGNKVDEFDFESLNKRQLAGNIYLAKVTRVEPSLQAAFIDYGGNRHGFLAFAEIHPDYYQIPKADREALLAEEAAVAAEGDEEPDAPREKPKPRGRSRSRRRPRASAEGAPAAEDAVLASEPVDTDGGAEASPAGDEAGLSDLPPPSAASGEVDIDVPDEPEDASGEATEAEAAADEDVAEARGRSEEAGDEPDASENGATEYESFGGQDDAADERPVRKVQPRRYKIQEVIKVRQILLVQVVKEERGNKGAALTTYLSLAGRYCVLMPNTARGGGISRKITNATDRKKLKEISSSITVPPGAGLIIRTAGASRTKTEIKRDYEYLLRQWEQIRDLTLRSIAPHPIYEEGSLVKRAIRDLYSREMDEILVDGERGYREAKDYMKMLMPSHARHVKHYADPLPLFSRHQVESYLSGMFNPVVQLKSGGYIVIDVTEALVAIDVNSGRATREASIEETALRTNLEAAEEAARQMRLRDLAGLIVIDFIDMEERKNNAAVEKRLKEKLKTDRARIQVGRISGFGLLEMSRQRLRPGMIEATTKSCPHCHGTGRVRSDDSIALALLRELEEEGVRQRSKEVLIVAPVEIANYLLNQKREHIAMIESRFGLSVRVEGDAGLISPDYKLERFKTASRIIPPAEGFVPPVIEEDQDDAVDEAEATEEAEEQSAEKESSSDKPSGKKRRRRRRRGGKGAQSEADQDERQSDPETPEAEAADPAGEPADAAEPKPRPHGEGFGEVIELDEDSSGSDIVEVPESEAPQRPARRQRVSQPAAAVLAEVPVVAVEVETTETTTAVTPPEAPVAEVEQAPMVTDAEAEAVPDTPADPAPAEAANAEPEPTEPEGAEPAAEADEATREAAEAPVLEMTSAGGQADEPPHAEETDAEDAPAPRRRRGWWSRS
jgi:ribonuclease E